MLFDVEAVNKALEPLLSHISFDGAPMAAQATKSASVRYSRNEAHEKRLKDVRFTCDALVTLEEKISRIRRDWQQREAVLTNAMAPVGGLPTEILREIFLLVAHYDRDAHIYLSHVSRRWRDVAIGLSELWTTMIIPQGHMDIIPSLVVRSRHHRFNLTMTYPPKLPILSFADASRLASVSLVGGESSRLELCPPEAMSVLKLDKVTVVQADPDLRECMAEWMLSAKGMALVRTGLENPDALAMSRLYELSISGVSGESVVETLRALNKNTPCLERLSLRGITGDLGEVDLIPQPMGGKLTYLRLHKCRADGWAPFAEGSLPNLKCFSVKFQRGLISCDYGSRILWDILLRSTKLETLDVELDDFYCPAIFDYVGPSSRGVSHSSLQFMRIRIYEWDLWDTESDEFSAQVCAYFRQKIAARLASGAARLKKLTATKELVRGNQEWFEEAVETLQLI